MPRPSLEVADLVRAVPVFALLGVLAILWVPQWQTRYLEKNGAEDKDRHLLVDTNRRTIMQMLGGLLLLIIGVYNVHNTVDTLEVARDQRTTSYAVVTVGPENGNSG